MRCCCDLQPDELNLLEDALQLWLVSLRNAPEPNAQLLSFFPNLVAAMERSTGKRLDSCQCKWPYIQHSHS